VVLPVALCHWPWPVGSRSRCWVPGPVMPVASPPAEPPTAGELTTWASSATARPPTAARPWKLLVSR